MGKTDEQGETGRVWATAARDEIADFMEKVADTVREPFIVLDPDLRVVFANDSFYATFRVERAATEGRLVYELGNDQWDIEELRRLLEEVLPNDERFGDYRVEHVFESVGRRVMVLNARRLDHVQLILLAIEDVTEREEADEALRDSEDRQAFLLELSDALRATDDPDEIEGVAARLLGRRLAATRVYYVAFDTALAQATVVREHVAADRPSLAGSYGLGAFRTVVDRLGDGRTWVVENIAREPLTPAERNSLVDHGVIAWIDTPLIRGGRLKAALCVVQERERRWTAAEIALTEDVAERTWDAVERARAERALRDSEARLAADLAHTTVLRDLSQRLVAEDDPATIGEEIITAAMSVLSADGAAVQRYDPATASLVLIAAHGFSSEMTGHYRCVDARSGTACGIALGTGERAFVDYDAADEDGALHIAAGYRSAQATPLVSSEGAPVGMLNTHWRAPRHRPTERELHYLDLLARQAADVIAQLQSRKALEESETRYRRLFQSMAEGYALADVLGAPGDAVDIRFVTANPAAERLLGEPLGGRRMGELDLGVDARAVDLFGRVARTGRPERLELDLRPAGRRLDFNVFKPDPADRQSARIALIFRDVTARREAEDAVKRSEARFRALVTAGAVSLYRMSPDWRFMYQLDSTNFLSTVGEPIEDWRERYILADDWPVVDAAIERAIRTGSVFDLEHRVALGDGRVGWVVSRAVPMLGPDGEIVEWFGTWTDMTARKDAEAALRKSEERFRSFAENSADTLWIVDAVTGALEYLSPAFEAMWGEPRDRVMHDLGRWAELVHPDDRERAMTAMPRLLRGESIQQTYRIVRPDGAVRHIQDTGFPIRNGDGRIPRVAGIAQDVTEQEEALLGVSASEQRLRLVVDAARDYAIFVTDPEGVIVEWMPGAAAVFGWSADELVGERADVLFTPEDRAAGEPAAELRSARENGAAANIRWHVAKGGRRVFIEGTVRPLRDAGGTLTGFLKIGQDVTGRRQTERRVAESERRLRALVEGMPQLVWRAADGGEWIWSSPQWSAFTGLPEAESIGYGWLDAVHPDDRERAMAAWEDADRRGRLDVEYRVRHAGEGRHRWFSTRAAPVRDETGSAVEWLGTSTDIDDLRRLQDQQGVLVAELQHRTRNLITVVRSIAQQTMQSAGSLEEFRPRFNDRLEALSRVQGLLSRSEEEPITIETLVRAELDALGVDPTAGRVHLEGPPVPLRHSAVQTLALALHELATNARKHGALSTGAGRLRVTWEAVDDENGRSVVIVWRETGGAPPSEAEPARKGYGRELIERALPYSLNADTSFLHDETGVTCTISIPLGRSRSRRSRP